MKTIMIKIIIGLVLCLFVSASVGAADQWIKVAGGKWEPSPKMVADLKAQIESYVRSQAKAQSRELKRWEDYTFQYQGREEKGRKFIFINAVCGFNDQQTLHKQIIVILDGGSCFFNLKYDPSQKVLFDLFINGEA